MPIETLAVQRFHSALRNYLAKILVRNAGIVFSNGPSDPLVFVISTDAGRPETDPSTPR